MRITCRCSSCGASYQVDQQFAGRKIKCPKCAAAIIVAAVAESPPTAAARPVKSPAGTPAAAKATSSPKSPAASPAKVKPAAPKSPAPVAAASAKSVAASRPKVAVAAKPKAAAGLDADLMKIPGLEGVAAGHARPSLGLPRLHVKKKPAGNGPLWLALGLLGGVVVLTVCIVAAVMIMQKGPPASTTPKAETVAAGWKKPPAKRPPSTTLELKWRELERVGGGITVDGDPVDLPAKGDVELELEVRSASHKICLTRPGYQTIEFSRMSAADEPQNDLTVRWIPLPRGFDDWLQDFDEAKRLAAKGGKSILILFDASDNSENSEIYRRQIFSQAEFRDAVEKDYVLVYPDAPKSDGANKAKVKDAKQNERVTKQFNVGYYPTVLLLDKEGRPIGVHEGLTPCDLKPFMEMLGKWREDGVQIQTLTAAVQSAPKGRRRAKRSANS